MSTPAAPDRVTCPTCRRAKSARAVLCRDCRRRANELGLAAVTQFPHAATAPAAPARQRTPQQNTVLHGKLSDLAKRECGDDDKQRLRECERRLKRAILDEAAALFGREIESSTELTESEMERVLEMLDHRLETDS